MSIRSWRVPTAILALACACSAGLRAQVPFHCDDVPAVPTVVRDNGFAELVSDYVLNCTGGVAGQNLVATLNVRFGNGVTSKTTAGASEVLLLINDPAPPNQVPGVNVIQGTMGEFINLVIFPNLSLPQPGPNRFLKLRFTNLRVDARTLPGLPPDIGAAVQTETIFPSPFGSGQTLALRHLALASQLRSAHDTAYEGAALSQCAPVNPGLAQSPSAPGGVVNFNVQFSERYVSAFAPRLNLASAPPDSSRTPGFPRTGESGFYNPAFPAAGGLNTAGLASQGTRLIMRFTGIPAGVSVFVTVTPSPFGTSAGMLAGARLTSTDPLGAGPYTPVAPTSTVTLNGSNVGIAPLTVTDGSAIAVWEILQSDPNSAEDVSFGVLVAYSGQPLPGSIRMRPGLAPESSDTSNQSQIVPRFASSGAVTNTLIIGACGAVLPDLQLLTLDQPSQAPAGTAITVTGTLLNNSATAVTDSFVTSYSLFEDSLLSRPVVDNEQAACGLSDLAGNTTALCSATLNIPGRLPPGTYYLGGLADDRGQIAESNEANNTAARQLLVTPCQFSLTRPSIDIPRGAGAHGVLVHAGDRCVWGATSDVPWLTILFSNVFDSAPSTRTLSFQADANPGPLARTGTIQVAGLTLTVNQAGAGFPSQMRVYRGGAWFVDNNRDHGWNGTPIDQIFSFGVPGDLPVMGDWDGSGLKRIGIFRDGLWYVDLNGNNAWDGTNGGDAIFSFGVPGDIPVVADWFPGQLRIGVYRDGLWYLDLNGNNQWDGASGDIIFSFGVPGDIPVAFDWDGSGFAKAGVYRNGLWYVDLNGNRQWDGVNGGDAIYSFGVPGDIPVLGDWDGSGQIRIGVYRNGLWYVDLNGNHQWDGTGPGGDAIFSFGVPRDLPIVAR